MERLKWFDRAFGQDTAVQLFPNLVERLRGTPVRLEERVRGLPHELLTRRVEEEWSIQENVGHLGDLEPLWAGRVDDILRGEAGLRPADLENRATHEAGHGDQPLEALLAHFRRLREEWVARVESLDSEQLEKSALHPRLNEPMRIVDLAFFVAEHDDHHLARVTEILRTIRGGA